jgi:hypothetical protein
MGGVPLPQGYHSVNPLHRGRRRRTPTRNMGRTLDFHSLLVLVVPALGRLLGGIVGLILAVIASKPSLACDREAPWRGSPNAPSGPCDASSAEVDHSITLPITLAHSWTARDFGSFGPSTRVRSDSRTS